LYLIVLLHIHRSNIIPHGVNASTSEKQYVSSVQQEQYRVFGPVNESSLTLTNSLYIPLQTKREKKPSVSGLQLQVVAT
jgi:hypothetical protein